MAKVFKSPVAPPTPDYKNYNREDEAAKEQAYFGELRKWLTKNGHVDKNAGKIIGFPVADGSAQYMIVSMSPIKLIHLPLGDAYSITAAELRGLRKTDIEALLSQESFWDKLHDENAKFLQKQPVGAILHYHNGFNQFVRQRVVIDKGVKKLLSIALVGEWQKHDLPHRGVEGTIYNPYHAKKILEGELDDSLQVSTTYESPQFVKGHSKADPRNLPPIELTLPPMTADQEEAARLWKLIAAVKEALSSDDKIPFDNPDSPRNRLLAAKKLLEPVS